MMLLLKKIPKTTLSIIFCALVVCVLIYVIVLRLNAETMGNKFGQSTGSQVGKLVGSFEATTDYREAYAEGKEQGLSAEDTTVEVANKIKEVQRLEVMVASVKLNDVHEMGEKYKALYLLKADAIFTVDLGKAEIVEEGEKLHIILPPLELDLIIKQSNIEKVAEYENRFFDGSSKDGFDAYINSMRKIVENSEETVVNYASLKMIAEQNAIRQVKQLANSVAVEKREVTVMFEEVQ